MPSKPDASLLFRLIVLAGLIVTVGCGRQSDFEGISIQSEVEIPNGQRLSQPSDPEIQQLARIVAGLLRDEPENQIDPIWSSQTVAVYLALRGDGRRLGEAWAGERTLLASLGEAIRIAKGQVTDGANIDTVELVIAHDFQSFELNQTDKPLSNTNRGVTGLELRYRDDLFMLSPTRMIAENQSFVQYIDVLNERWRLSDLEIIQEVTLRSFHAKQFLIRLSPTIRIDRMFRGNQLIPPSAVNKVRVTAMAQRLSDWLVESVHPDGRMTYLYKPGQGEDPTRNNTLRQWMATVNLMRIAQQRKDAGLTRLANNNIRYNLDKFYRVEDNLGFIEYRDKAKLGAVAMATLAIMNCPNRSDFAAEEIAMRRTIDYLWNDDGSFRTFYKPATRNNVQNFYPGETLLVWALLYRESQDAELLQKILKSYEYYRAWHMSNRNPAFVPWHTQAYYLIWQETDNRALADWVFEMNDWLLGMQQRSASIYADTQGRFYDPSRPFGPPHASSTAVYLEGLIDAFAMARALEDSERAERYRVAIVGGLRSLMQLEFSDHIDLFYVGEAEKVRGGMRTTVYDNQIRVDNVQHTLMALQKILVTFSDRDYRPQ